MGLVRELRKISYMVSFFIQRKPYFLSFNDLRIKKRKYKVKTGEYFSLRLYDLSMEQMDSFVSNYEYNLLLDTRINDDMEARLLLRDKGVALRRLPYNLLKRGFLDLRTCTFADFAQFLQRHKKVVIKPHNSAGGNQVTVIDAKEQQLLEKVNVSRLDALFKYCMDNELYIIEEYIKQHRLWAKINPDCVNTIRVHTFNDGQGQYTACWQWLARCGRRGEKHDMKNAFVMLVDPKDGQVLTDACDEGYTGTWWRPDEADYMREFNEEAAIRYRDLVVPFNDEIKELVSSAASFFPEIRFIGWDIALTADGPVIVEGNACPQSFGRIQQLNNLFVHTVDYRRELAKLCKKI